MMRAGSIALVVGVVLVLTPLLLGQGMLNKYIVVVGFLCACAGLGLLLNGLIDRLRHR